MTVNPPLMLLTNDDGIDAPGLKAMAEALRGLGDVRVLAPERQMSAVGHQVSVGRHHALKPFLREGKVFGWSFDGAPADCVKFAVAQWLERRPDLVVSGVNAGSNMGYNIPYSGTVAAAVEAAMLGIPGMAVSLLYRKDEAMEFETAAKWALPVAKEIIQRGLAPFVALNVNIPPLPDKEIKGYRVAPQGHFRVIDDFEKVEHPEKGVDIWTNRGTILVGSDNGQETDDHALGEGYATVTPLSFDMTAHNQMDEWRRRMSPASR